MGSIPQTIERLRALREQFGAMPQDGADGLLAELTDFGSNPGSLRALRFVPDDLAPGAALVVVLHGCTQTATGYDHGSGWSRLAEEQGFAVLLPEQQRANNPNLCFNWFAAADARRDRGEALSIVQMVAAMVRQHGIDPARIFVTGLSAGGAMTAVMLATYPELFAGGAVIAGLPYGTAWSVQDALTRMRGQGVPRSAELADLVTNASTHDGRWPTISIWHGDADTTVAPANAEALVAQWRSLHGIDSIAPETQTSAGHQRRAWRDRDGRDVVEAYIVRGMGHGTPLKTGGDDGCGASGPYMLDVGLSSTRLIATGWGLIDPSARKSQATSTGSAGQPGEDRLPFHMPVHLPAGVERTIKDALRTAGLLR